MARLQQQAAQIKQLLKLLNSSSVNLSTGSSSSTNIAESVNGNDTSSNQPANLAQDETVTENGGYESLWELSERTLTNIPEVETTTEAAEEEDVLDEQEDLYENTGILANNFTMAVGKFMFSIFPRFPNNAFEMQNWKFM